MTTQQTLKNRNCMMAVVYADELRHHGVEGMSWGERNGPPYPLGGLDKKVARAEAKRKKARERALEKARKAAKKKRKAEARDARREEREARQEEKDQLLKEKLLKKGDLDAIRKHRKLFTTQELIDAVNRARVLEEVKSDKTRKKEEDKPSKPEKQKKSAQEIMNDVTRFANTVNSIGVAAITTKNLVDGIVKMNRDKELHQLAVEAKELTNLKLAVGARDAGANPKDSYFRAEKKIQPASDTKVSKDDKIDTALQKLISDAKISKDENTDSKTVKDGSKKANDDSKTITSSKLGGLVKKQVGTPEFWSSVEKTKVSDIPFLDLPKPGDSKYRFFVEDSKTGRVDISGRGFELGKKFANTYDNSKTQKTKNVDVNWLNSQISSLTGISFGSGSGDKKKQRVTSSSERASKREETAPESRKFDPSKVFGDDTARMFRALEARDDQTNQWLHMDQTLQRTSRPGTTILKKERDRMMTVPLKDISTGGNTKSGSGINVDVDALLKSIGSFKL